MIDMTAMQRLGVLLIAFGLVKLAIWLAAKWRARK
jgi:hypothetical protein